MKQEDNTVVVFIKNNARILHNPVNLESLKKDPKALINPDLTAVKGLPPHFWANLEGKIVPLSSSGQSSRAKAILAGDFSTKIGAYKETPTPQMPGLTKIALVLTSAALVILAWRFHVYIR